MLLVSNVLKFGIYYNTFETGALFSSYYLIKLAENFFFFFLVESNVLRIPDKAMVHYLFENLLHRDTVCQPLL